MYMRTLFVNNAGPELAAVHELLCKLKSIKLFLESGNWQSKFKLRQNSECLASSLMSKESVNRISSKLSNLISLTFN